MGNQFVALFNLLFSTYTYCIDVVLSDMHQ